MREPCRRRVLGVRLVLLLTLWVSPAVAQFCPKSGTSCEDGDVCTTNDNCVENLCIGGPPLDCGDGNECTTDTCIAFAGCSHTDNTDPCSDGDACTTNDTCGGGNCQPGVPLDCNDGNVCTSDGCDPGSGCTHTFNAASCSDGNACTTNDTCGSGNCQPGTPLDCNDGNVCTSDGCDPGSGCTHTFNAASCSDGNACTTNDTCGSGNCQPGTPLDCGDGNVCTSDGCDPGSGCAYAFNTASCSDGNACTTNDTCGSGNCQPGAPLDCSDGNVCTSDGCDPGSGCAYAFNTASCSDGNACTTNDTCGSGNCQPGTPLDCGDGNVCTSDGCDPGSGCAYAFNTASCSDGNACTTNDTCGSGNCQPGAPLDCSDGNVCTSDGCDPGSGCAYAFNTASCSDGNACTTNDTCGSGNCQPGTPLDCGDGNVCTSDGCDPGSGCAYAFNTASCSDGDACTTNDTCGSGNCQPGAPLDCSDGNVCTSDGCDPGSGCAYAFNTASCSDGNACTTNDTCGSGNCQPGTPLDCGDGNVCTSDGCDPGSGCAYAFNTASCSDGDACTTNDTCGGGNCQAGPVAPPFVSEVQPFPDSEGQSTATNVTVHFSEPMDPATLLPSTLRLLGPGGLPVPAGLSLDPSGQSATLDPDGALAAATEYAVSVTGGIEDLEACGCSPFTSAFRTAGAPSPFVPLPDASDEAGPPAPASMALNGTSVSRAGDLDGDLLMDLVSGAPGYQLPVPLGASALDLAPDGSAVEAGAVLVYLGATTSAGRESPDIIFTGVAAHDRAGVSVASGFDFDGDGTNDLLIGAEQVDRATNPASPTPTGAGRAYLIYFEPADYPNLADPDVPDIVSLSLVGTTIGGVVFQGAALGDLAGFAVAGGGLLDAGSAPDILIGAPGVDATNAGMLINAGAAYGIFNQSLTGVVELGDVACTHRTVPCTPAEQVEGVVYEAAGAGFEGGSSVAFAGPLTNTPGMTASWNAAIGAPGANLGAPGGGLVGIVMAGDEDSTIIPICSHGTVNDGATIVGTQPGMQLGRSVTNGGDARADGAPDLLIGAPRYDVGPLADAGLVVHVSDVLPFGVYAFSEVGTDAGGALWTGAAAGDQLGFAVAGLGDVTGDGLDDVALGAPFADPLGQTDAGAVYVIAGAAPADFYAGSISVATVGLTTAGSVYIGTTANEQAGTSLGGAGDVDGRGGNDFVVGAPGIAGSTGTVYIVLPDDADADGRTDTFDCDPVSALSWSVPGEVRALTVARHHVSGTTTLSWSAPLEIGGAASALRYNTVRSASPSNFVAAAQCVETSGSDTSSSEIGDPSPGVAAFYLVVAENACGQGSPGASSSGSVHIVRSCP